MRTRFLPSAANALAEQVPLARVVTALLLLCLGAPRAQAANDQQHAPSLTTLQQQADQLHLADARQWRRLLFIPDRWYPSDTSIIEDERFFLAPSGSRDPTAELTATLAAMLAQGAAAGNDDLHVRCRHPARTAWLAAQLHLDDAQLPRVNCQTRDDFLATLAYDRVSLVFSNYYLGNPASLFGHMFLKLHRVRKAGEEEHPLG